MCIRDRCRAEQLRRAPRDRRGGVDPLDRPGREPGQAFQQQRIMRAGQHDGVGAGRVAGAVADEAGRELGRDVLVAHALAAEGGFRQRGELAGADQRHLAALRKIRDQLAGVFPLHGAPGAEHRDAAGLRRGAGRLDRRHGADEGQAVGITQMRHHQGRCRVAGDHDEVGRVSLDQLADQRHHAGDDLVLGVVAIGEERVIGDIDVMRVGPGADDLA